jgi:hypothetical protein
MTRSGRPILALALASSISGCPQERPEAARQIPREHVPPAVSLEPPIAAGHPPASPRTHPPAGGGRGEAPQP